MSRQALLLCIVGALLVLTGLWYLSGWFSTPVKMTPQQAAEAAISAPTPQARERAAVALAPMGAPALPQMREVLQKTNAPEVKAVMIQGLGMERDYDSMEYLLAALEDESLIVRSRAVCAVHRLLQVEGNYRADAPPEERRREAQRLREEWQKMRHTPGLRKSREKIQREIQAMQ